MGNTYRKVQAVYFVIVVLLLCSTLATASTNDADTIHWRKDRHLTWDDFQGIPDTSSIGGAGTVSGFYTDSHYISDTSIRVTVIAVFYKKDSWQKTQYQTIQSLNHEQGHFNITEVFARKVTAAFRKYKYDRITVNKDIDSIISGHFNEMTSIQSLYDKETRNHRNFAKQKEWDKKIATWLKSTN